ncbi:MAG: acyl-CoA dehydrogenase family protein [Desulfobacterales bacterium]
MDLDLNKEQKILKKSAQEFLKKECPTSLLREMKDDEKGYPEALWKKMADLGWMGVMIPEAYDGIGGDFLDLAILLESMGEVNCPGPFFSTVVLGATAIIEAGNESQKKALLPGIANGDLILAYAATEPEMYYDAAAITMTAKPAGESFELTGTKLFVENAHIADYMICAARTSGRAGDRGGISLFLVNAKRPGISVHMLDTLAFDKQCEVVFDQVKVNREDVIGGIDGAWEIMDRLQTIAITGKCAEMVGGIQTAFDTTVAYAKERKQFNRPIGSFQAVQHHCSNMVMDVDSARFITYKAAWEIAEGMDASLSAAMAKAWTGTAGQRVTILAHQIHGAIAFCEEMDLHLYYRRAKAGEVFMGDSDFYLEKIAHGIGL